MKVIRAGKEEASAMIPPKGEMPIPVPVFPPTPAPAAREDKD
jgi:hypothetical protein